MKHVTCLLLLLVAYTLLAQVQLVSSATITGTSAAVALTSTDAPYWVQFTAPSANASHARCGDSATTSSRGLDIPPGAGQMLPSVAPFRYNSLTTVFCYVATGDTLVVSWAK